MLVSDEGIVLATTGALDVCVRVAKGETNDNQPWIYVQRVETDSFDFLH